ncbi:QacE family quaternary ammonium compound efflux SMR transporter [Sporosarcina sp. P37]|uniref:DMT family transporter n=1 Tax=unclassified Sporosarcina TaxID=2647733 RepID=UPI0009C0C68D|nr:MULTISPECIES: multidrug efflux SMR transporter [unclassified Sporosarcina]ARD47843.1 multidrug resistance protein SMR [Sporosarcina sp. P33]ARK24371.1 QacE family quaternary ammonium compound efflux SMR transporter [Sporosarcina sp. P37]PID17450.1 QacE family quaternary ammonium compound efflux SMR transporter [Sporosarcina sp. P35]
MAWVYLIIASLGEIFGVMSINYYLQNRSVKRLLLIVGIFGFGFVFLSLAMREIQMSTAYAVWTGLGAAGAVLMGILIFKEPASGKRLFFLSLIILGAVGLKLFG